MNVPRINASNNVPLDFCWQSFPKTEEVASRLFGNRGDGQDGRGSCFAYNTEHPAYNAWPYHCPACRRKLTAEDN
jgi:hypothetical protein